MYPDIRYLLQGLTGLQMPAWLGLFKTFGLMVAMAFIGAAWATATELRRKAKAGLLRPEVRETLTGKTLTPAEIALAALTGFLLGFKIGGIFGHVADVSPDPMGYLLSKDGNLLVGIAGAALMAFSKYREGKKQELPEPKIVRTLVYPHDLILEIVIVAAAGGLAGAKLFNAFESWNDFIQHPIQNLTSSSGLTFLGGLIVATISFYFFARRHNIPFPHLCDAAAPGIMLAYGIGRLGCQLAGDGDWGIYNTAYVAGADGRPRLADAADQIAIRPFLEGAAHTSFRAPSWLPDWLFGMTYPHNVNMEGRAIAGCVGEYCNALPISVFPTPIYEAIACILLFVLLWRLRPRLSGTLKVFGAYLLLAGIERFLVELIRVNYKYDWGFLHPTQAEILSVALIICGTYLVFIHKPQTPVQPAPDESN